MLSNQTRSFRSFVSIFATLIGLGLFGCSVSGAQSPISLTIDTQSPGFAIPDDFAGLSFETGSERPNKNGVSGYLFCATNTPLITLFQNTGLHNLRLGGGTVDGLSATIPTYTDIDNAFAFAQAAGIKIIYSVRLENGTNTDAAAEAQYIWQRYRAFLFAFAIGNEPDWNSYHYPPFGAGTDPAITGYPGYLADWRSFAAAMTNAAPGATFVGPDTGSYTNSTYFSGKSWTELFAGDEKTSGLIAAVTQHYYVGGSPGTTSASQAVENMLSANWVTTQYPWLYDHNIAPVIADGMAYRLTESNDYLSGVTNASDSFASALWTLDYMHWWAAHNCGGVNFHNKSWLRTDTIYLDAAGTYQVHPKAYGVKAFDLGGHGYVEPFTITNSDGLNLTAYAVGNTNTLYVTVINKEHGSGSRDASVVLATGGMIAGSASTMFLTAPAANAAATNGVLLGGASITNNAPWLGHWVFLGAPTNGQFKVTVPATSAAIVKIEAAPVGPAIISITNHQAQITWSGGMLQCASNLSGPYIDMSGAMSPYTIATTNARRFFRVKQ
jgi:hypothetical protein